jgi:hypothetical protein
MKVCHQSGWFANMLVLTATTISWSAAWFLMNRLPDDFTYRIETGIFSFNRSSKLVFPSFRCIKSTFTGNHFKMKHLIFKFASTHDTVFAAVITGLS